MENKNRSLLGSKDHGNLVQVLLTRPSGQNQDWKDFFEEKGAKVFLSPLIEIEALKEPDQLDFFTDKAASDGWWVCFFSSNGIEYFFRRAAERGRAVSDFSRCRFAVVGQSTGAKLESIYWPVDRKLENSVDFQIPPASSFQLSADFLPDSANAAAFARQFLQEKYRSGDSVLLVGADRGKADAAEILRDSQVDVHQVAAYQHKDVDHLTDEVNQALDLSLIHWVVLTSSAAAVNFVKLAGPRLKSVKIATISPITAEKVLQLGLECHAVAQKPTAEAIWSAIIRSESQR